MKPKFQCGIISKKCDFLLTYSSYSADITGFVAQVKIKVEYLNQSEEADEVDFVFPVEEDSAVYAFEADIGDRHLVAVCKDKEKAKKDYEKAKKEGKTAIIMSETNTSGDIFEYQLGNIPPKETVTIQISMLLELSCEKDAAVRFHLPLVLNQRYGSLPKGEVYKTQPKAKETSFNATINWPSGIKEIKSDEAIQKIKVEFKDEKRKATISLSEKLDFDKDILFYIYYEKIDQLQSVIAKAEPNGKEILGKDVMMLNLFPKLPNYEHQVRQEYIFIVDRSGSMQGERIESAKQTLLFFLKSLPVECAFNVISFSNDYNFLFAEGSRKYSEETMAAALKFHSELFASGGTELLRALRSLSSLVPYEGFFRQVFLMTDGEVYNTKEVIDCVKAQAKESRFFTVGIGSGASTELVKGIARAGQGKAEFVMENDNLNKKVMSLLKLSMQPVVNRASLVVSNQEYQDKFSFSTVPKNIPSIFSEERFILYLLLDKVDKKLNSVTLTLSGKIGKTDFSQNFEANLESKVQISDLYIHRLCTRRVVQQLEIEDLEEKKEGKFKEEIIRLAMAANLVSKYTAFQAESEIPLVFGQSAMMNAPLMRCAPPMAMMCMSAPPPPPPQKSKLFKERRRRGIPCNFDLGFGLSNNKNDNKKGKSKVPTKTKDSSNSSDDVDDNITFGCSDEDEEEDDDECLGLFGDSSKSVPPKKDFTLTYLITLQSFVGNWKLDKNLSGFFQMSVTELQAKKPEKSISDDIWGTALAVALMREKFIQQKYEWELLENKAIHWLKSQSFGKSSFDEIFTAANELIAKI